MQMVKNRQFNSDTEFMFPLAYSSFRIVTVNFTILGSNIYLSKVIGKTSEGQNMVVVAVGHHGGNNNRPGIFIEGGIHAR